MEIVYSQNNIPNLNVNISNETQDKTYTANYQINTYNITYELNGGIANNPTTYTIEDNITLKNPTKTGYTFIGWKVNNQTSYKTDYIITEETYGYPICKECLEKTLLLKEE